MAQASTGDKKLSTVDSGLGKAGDNRIYNASSNLVERSRPSDSDSAWGDILVDSVSDLESGTPWSASEDVRKPPARETSAGLEPLHVEGNDSSDNAADDSFSHLDAQANAEVGNWDDTEEATEEALDEGVDELRPNWLTDNFVDTELGGLLYLINLLEQLELPEAMDVDWHFDARLGRWGFLELIALGLLNESLEGLKDDPLWHLLAKLSGRKPGSPIGERYLSDFVPDFRLPPDWWKHLISAVDRSVHLWWAVQADRMRIWCDECVLVDHAVGSDGPPHPDGLLASVQAELRPYQQGGEALPIGSGPFDRAPWERPSDALVRAAGAPLCRWVSMAMPFLRWFLQRQLHLDSATGDRLMETLLGLPARIYFTPSHVDMVADVNLTSLAIRRSGLDQDPGWQPLYGRVLLFHFCPGVAPGGGNAVDALGERLLQEPAAGKPLSLVQDDATDTFRAQDHYALNLFAGIHCLLAHIDRLSGVGGESVEQHFSRYPFLREYHRQILLVMPASLSWPDGRQWWRANLRAIAGQSGNHLPLEALDGQLRFRHETIMALMLAGLVEEDSRFGTLFADLQQPLGYRRPMLETLGQVVAAEDAVTQLSSWDVCSPLLTTRLVQADDTRLPRSEWVLKVDPVLWDLIRTGQPEVSGQRLKYLSHQQLTPMDGVIVEHEFQQRLKGVPSLFRQGRARILVLRAPEGSHSVEVSGAVAQALGKNLVVQGPGPEKPEADETLGISCTLLNAMPVYKLDLAPGETAHLPALAGYDGPIIVILGKEGGLDTAEAGQLIESDDAGP